MVFLDVVYNHFGPEGNYLAPHRAAVLRRAHRRPGAPRSIIACREVRDFVIDNALHWLEDYRFDGLRLDAVHAIVDARRAAIS